MRLSILLVTRPCARRPRRRARRPRRPRRGGARRRRALARPGRVGHGAPRHRPGARRARAALRTHRLGRALGRAWRRRTRRVRRPVAGRRTRRRRPSSWRHARGRRPAAGRPPRRRAHRSSVLDGQAVGGGIVAALLAPSFGGGARPRVRVARRRRRHPRDVRRALPRGGRRGSRSSTSGASRRSGCRAGPGRSRPGPLGLEELEHVGLERRSALGGSTPSSVLIGPKLSDIRSHISSGVSNGHGVLCEVISSSKNGRRAAPRSARAHPTRTGSRHRAGEAGRTSR